MKIAKLNIEGYIGGADMISLFSGEETFNLTKLKKYLDSLEADVTDLHVYINSGGGSVNEGWAIYDKLKTSGYNVTTIGEGMVGSIATIIYMAGTTRKLHENTKFFIHNPYWQPDAPTPMEAEDLINLGEDLKSEQKKILDFYANQTGTPLEQIEPLMSKATDLTSSQAIEMGFAQEVITSAINYKQYKLVAMIDKKQTNQNTMTQVTKEMSMLKRFGLMLNRFMKGNFKNMDIPVIDEAGNNVKLFVESETEDLTGKNCYLITEDGEQTTAPDGKYTDGEGKVIVVKGGVVDSVEDALNSTDDQPNVEALNSKIAELEAQKAEITTQLEASKSESAAIKGQLEVINVEFNNLKNTLIGAGAEFKTAAQSFDNNKGGSVTGSDAGNAFAQRFKNKRK